MKDVLKENWYTCEIAASVDIKSAGIYEWRIEGVGIYVGKARRLHRRINNYSNNIRRMINGHDWHGNPNKKYRTIHEALREAHDEGRKVTVVVLATCDGNPETRRRLEQKWIAQRRCEEKQGGYKVLNQTTRPTKKLG